MDKNGKRNCNLSVAIHLYNSQENLVIPKESIYCGFVDVVTGNGSILEIELEKEITISRGNFFKETKEKGFEMHEIDVDKVLKNAKEYFEIDDELENDKRIIIK